MVSTAQSVGMTIRTFKQPQKESRLICIEPVTNTVENKYQNMVTHELIQETPPNPDQPSCWEYSARPKMGAMNPFKAHVNGLNQLLVYTGFSVHFAPNSIKCVDEFEPIMQQNGVFGRSIGHSIVFSNPLTQVSKKHINTLFGNPKIMTI